MHSWKMSQKRRCGVSDKSRSLAWAECFAYDISLQSDYHSLIVAGPQATLEIEFIHQTLSRSVTPSAAKTLSELYNKISQAYARKSGDENLQVHLDGVKKTLADTRRATGIEFLCFRQTKNKDKPSNGSTTPRPRERDRRERET